MMRLRHIGILGMLLLGGGGTELLHAAAVQDGQHAWLRYAPLESAAQGKYESLPASLIFLGDSVMLRSAREEIIRGIKGMTGKTLLAGTSIKERAIVLGTF